LDKIPPQEKIEYDHGHQLTIENILFSLAIGLFQEYSHIDEFLVAK